MALQWLYSGTHEILSGIVMETNGKIVANRLQQWASFAKTSCKLHIYWMVGMRTCGMITCLNVIHQLQNSCSICNCLPTILLQLQYACTMQLLKNSNVVYYIRIYIRHPFTTTLQLPNNTPIFLCAHLFIIYCIYKVQLQRSCIVEVVIATWLCYNGFKTLVARQCGLCGCNFSMIIKLTYLCEFLDWV